MLDRCLAVFFFFSFPLNIATFSFPPSNPNNSRPSISQIQYCHLAAMRSTSRCPTLTPPLAPACGYSNKLGQQRNEFSISVSPQPMRYKSRNQRPLNHVTKADVRWQCKLPACNTMVKNSISIFISIITTIILATSYTYYERIILCECYLASVHNN